MAATGEPERHPRRERDAEPCVSSVQRRVDALSDVALTDEEAKALDQLLASPSTLAPAFSPTKIPPGDRSLLYRTTR
jgi:hypothetical protein